MHAIVTNIALALSFKFNYLTFFSEIRAVIVHKLYEAKPQGYSNFLCPDGNDGNDTVTYTQISLHYVRRNLLYVARNLS